MTMRSIQYVLAKPSVGILNPMTQIIAEAIKENRDIYTVDKQTSYSLRLHAGSKQEKSRIFCVPDENSLLDIPKNALVVVQTSFSEVVQGLQSNFNYHDRDVLLQVYIPENSIICEAKEEETDTMSGGNYYHLNGVNGDCISCKLLAIELQANRHMLNTLKDKCREQSLLLSERAVNTKDKSSEKDTPQIEKEQMKSMWETPTVEQQTRTYLVEALQLLRSAKSTFAPHTTNSNADVFMERISQFLAETAEG